MATSRTRSQYRSGIQTFYDDQQNHEVVHPMSPCRFQDDFFYKTLPTTDLWTAVDVSSVGNTTPVMVADGANGVARMPLDATSEAQESGLTWNDQRPLVLNQGLIFECALNLSTLPTLLSIAVWGLAGDKNAVADTVAESIWFRTEGNGVVTVECDDTTAGTTKDDIATGTTLLSTTKSIFRIDCSVIADCKFYINGARVASGTTFNMSAVPTLALQPYFHIAKASGAGLGVMDLDKVAIWQRRS